MIAVIFAMAVNLFMGEEPFGPTLALESSAKRELMHHDVLDV